MKLNRTIRPAKSFSIAIVPLLVALALLLPGYARPLSAAEPRQRILLDDGWRFLLAPGVPLTNTVEIAQWRYKSAATDGQDEENAGATVDTAGPGWKDAKSGDDTFQGQTGFQWFRAPLPDVSGPHRIIHFDSVDDNATVYLNGRKLARHQGWNQPFDVPVDDAWVPGGPNLLAVLVQNNNGPGGINPHVVVGRQLPTADIGDPFEVTFDDHAWQRVHLPHDYVIDGPFTSAGNAGHGSLIPQPAWYRKSFTLPASAAGRSVWLDFDGVYRDSIVYLNGRKLGEHESGYTPFRYDISRAANFGGENILAVYVDPRNFEGWWYEGGGIYRHVWLNIADPVHVAPWGTFVTAELPEPGADGVVAPAMIHINTRLANAGNSPADGVIVSRLVDDRGQVAAVVTTPVTVPAGGEQELAQQTTVAQPRLWSLESPVLYQLQTVVKINGRIVDTVTTPFGIRTERFDVEKGFFLNGKHVEIQGTCNHQDFAGVGVAVADSLEYWRVKQLKEMGANAWRMSHNPPNPELLEACDKLGMLVMDENRHLGDTYSDHTSSGTDFTNLDDLKTMILRDRDHPSIIMWSMCNEEGLEGTPEGAKIFSAMMQVVHHYDTTRPISCAMNGGWFDPGFATVEDLLGVNYYPEVYDRLHKARPTMPMFGSETASTLTTRGEYADNHEKVFVSSYNMTDGAWAPVAERPFMAGSFAWTGFDYKGEPTPYGWPCINSHFGLLDMCGFPKDNYYYLQSWWKTNALVHVLPHWNWPGREGQDIKVIVFGNCERVELFLNGTSLGIKEMPRNGHLEWMVKYAPGSVTAKGLNGDVVAATDTVETTGAPASLRLKTDRTSLRADGEDVSPVEVDVLDAQGRIVPTADNVVTFAVSGAGDIAGVGNGNPGDHDPDHANYRHAFNGKCLVVVGAGVHRGAIHLTATSPGLKPAELSLRATSGN